jgi:hypothetical protein
MSRWGPLPLVATFWLACATPHLSIPIWVRSHNRSEVDVYLLCGDRATARLGIIPPKESGRFEIPTARAQCASGLNFFLVQWDIKRGYWVGPFRPRGGVGVDLTIEKYAGLSNARLFDDTR